MDTNASDNDTYTKRTQWVKLRLTPGEKQQLTTGASRRHRSLSDYIRWLFVVDHESGYRLTDQGREALDDREK